eukprot:TRINITY_DN41535_c0_g1_i1.p1 TRINITY_DN41535_c0_g1~~TRINITY_DN41535_c0_g1_i1.p1  ORF type:complete len:194 (+),score=45.29 TRINITY_DN41535_c0_g1_i1:66-584(+)
MAEPIIAKPMDLAPYLVGTWKRVLEERDFGGAYQYRRTPGNFLVVIKEDESRGGEKGLRWSCAASAPGSEMRPMYRMRLRPAGPTEAECTYEYKGRPCSGRFYQGPNALMLTHVHDGSDDGSSRPSQEPDAAMSVVYRIIDRDSMAVCVAEAEAQGPGRVQLGMMYRLDTDA